MAIFRRNPFDQLEDMQRQMDRYLDHFAGAKRPVCFYSPSAWQPAMDIYTTADELIVVLETAGMDKDSLEISTNRNSLTIRGERQDNRRGAREKYHMAEITFGWFERVIELPVPVDPERASASYNDGLLEIVLPKVNERTPKSVQIKTVWALRHKYVRSD